MSKKEILKILDLASFIAAIIATVLVFFFQFTGTYMVMKMSIVMYDVCFLSLSAVLGLNVHTAFSKKSIENKNEEIKEENVSPETSNDNMKKTRTMSIVWLSLSVVAFIFTTIIMVLY